MISRFIIVLILFLRNLTAQRVILIIADGLGAPIHRRFSNYPAFRTFEDEGVWSVRMKPVFPSLPLPNRHSLMTGLVPRRHGLIGDYVYNLKSGESFDNFTQSNDYSRDWWTIEPIYELARRSGAKVAIFFFPECEVHWKHRPQICLSEMGDITDEKTLKIIIESTRKHDLVIVNHVKIREELARIGMSRAQEKTLRSVHAFEEALERIIGEVRIRIDLNLLVVSTHSLIDVPRKNIRFLDDYLPMELINRTIGCGAFKQLQAKNGKTHQVYSQLKYHSPIPNISIYYTTHKAGNIPEWYEYKKSSTVPDLVLIAQPGYAIAAREKQIPPYEKSLIPTAISGYNAEYPPAMGVFLAYGPVFKKGVQKAEIEICDVYVLLCNILQLECNPSTGRLTHLQDIIIPFSYQYSNTMQLYHQLAFITISMCIMKTLL